MKDYNKKVRDSMEKMMRNFGIPLKVFKEKVLPEAKLKIKKVGPPKASRSEGDLSEEEEKKEDLMKKPSSILILPESDEEEEEKETSAIEIDEESLFASIKEDNKEEAK